MELPKATVIMQHEQVPTIDANVSATLIFLIILICSLHRPFLKGLTIDGHYASPNGITLSSATSLCIVHCTLRHFTHDGIYLRPTGQLQLSILDTIASNNNNDGIDLSASGGYHPHEINELIS
jgi:hypothetical protein